MIKIFTVFLCVSLFLGLTSCSEEVPSRGIGDAGSGVSSGAHMSQSLVHSGTKSKVLYASNALDPNPILINEAAPKPRVYLMDKTGSILYEWSLGDKKLGVDAFLLDNGTLLAGFQSKRPKIIVGGFGGISALLSPTGSTLWEYELSDSGSVTHHDTELLPNGNILAIAWDKIPKDRVGSHGYTLEVDIFPERIIEIDPDDDTIVWEWRSMDHIIQDTDPKVAHYGKINAHPERININHAHSQSGMVMHANGISYDEKNDLIYLSMYSFSEIWVIDHSTTTAEARGSTGGTYKKGGDLVYRFGNPSAYGGTGERLFYSNHHPNFTESGTFLIYSNGIRATPEQASVYELRLPQELSEKKSTNKPPEIVWSYTHPEIYFDKVGGAVRLPNGNTLITEGDGMIWEVTPKKEIAWKYNTNSPLLWRSYSYKADSEAIRNLLGTKR